MSTLWERIAHNLPDQTDGLPAHEFTDSLILVSEGELTKANIVNFWELTPAQELELDEIAAAYTALPANQKALYGDRMERAFRLLALNVGPGWDETTAKAYLGIA